MATLNKENGRYTQDPKNTLVNVHVDTKEELKLLLIEESFKRGDRVYMKELIQELLEFYKDNNDK